MRSVPLILSLGLLAGCTASAAEPPTAVDNAEVETVEVVTPSCNCARVTVREYFPPDPTTGRPLSPTPWVSGARHMSAVVTASSTTRPGFLVWGVGDGVDIAWVYWVPSEQRGALMNQLNRTFATMETPGSSVSWVIAGGVIVGPGGGGPGPGGDPDLALVRRVLRTAGNLQDTTEAQTQFDPRK